MYVDNNLLFSDAQALTATGVGTNVYDSLTAASLGSGEPLAVVFVVDVAADQTTGDEDYTFEIEYASDAAQTTARQLLGRRVFESGTPTAPAQNADLLVAGFKFVIPVPPVTQGEDERYFGIRYTLAGTSPSITCTAYLAPMHAIESAADTFYPSGYTIT